MVEFSTPRRFKLAVHPLVMPVQGATPWNPAVASRAAWSNSVEHVHLTLAKTLTLASRP